MKRILAFALVFVFVFCMLSISALAVKDPVISPEGDVPNNPRSPQTGYAFDIFAVVVCAVLCCGVGLVCLRKVLN